MKVENLLNIIGADFYTGVPDSQLKALCDYLMSNYGIDSRRHIIAANEGNCVAIATGYYFATGKVPIVYMQNSGEGNIINPVASLLNQKVYAIPMIFIIGWRGEPTVYDEPQHSFQGEITCKLLELMNIKYFVIGEDTPDVDVQKAMDKFKTDLHKGKQVAFLIRKNALYCEKEINYNNDNVMYREEIIRSIVKISGEDPVISTTGKTSRELFEIREMNQQGHEFDFLTVGSMGHASSIALGVALSCPHKKIWCIDGDGAALMHMGAMPVIASCHPKNLVHIVINNGSHESVGGQPTVANHLNLYEAAKAFGYPSSVCVSNMQDLEEVLYLARSKDRLSFIEVKSRIGARNNLGRPTSSALENKMRFMTYLKN